MPVLKKRARGTEKFFEKDKAKGEVYRGYIGLVTFIVSEKLLPVAPGEIEDVVSGVWEKLFSDECRRLKSFSDRSQFSTWIAKVALNAARDYLRRKRPPVVSLDALVEDDGNAHGILDVLPDRSPDPLNRLLVREFRKEVLSAVKRLPKIYRDVVFLKFYKRLDVTEIAGRCGIDEDTVYVRLARAFGKLRKPLMGYCFVPGTADACPDISRTGARHLSAAEMLRILDHASSMERGRVPALGRSSARIPDAHLSGCYGCFREFFVYALLWLTLEKDR